MGDPETERNAGTLTATEETVPAEDEFDASSLTVPAEFLKYSFSSSVLMASSPSARLVFTGTAAAVAVR